MIDLARLVLLAAPVIGLAATTWLLVGQSSSNKAGGRRLQTLRARHSPGASHASDAARRSANAKRLEVGKRTSTHARWRDLELRLKSAGAVWSVTRYLRTCAGAAVAIALAVLLISGSLSSALLIGAALGLGFPHLAVGMMIARRRSAFTVKFPDAIELLVRGLRSGLPVSETIGVIAAEVAGPVGEEFKTVSERMKIGKSMDEALAASAERLGMPEFDFFVISLAIQHETGGNLAETLSNLAEVLRKRGQMKLKIKAMSSESKASAYIVGALPFVVFAMIYWVNPGYLAKFFIDPRLSIAGIGGFVWMALGVFIMAKMVSFEI